MEITVNGIACDDEREAKRAIAKAKREERKERERETDRHQRATADAYKNFYDLARHLERITFERKKDNWARVAVWCEAPSLTICAGYYTASFCTANGRGKLDNVCLRPLEKIQSVGHDIAVKLEEAEGNFWYALGIADGEAITLEIPASLYNQIESIRFFER